MSLRKADLETCARDMWPRMLLGYREGHRAPPQPHATVCPEQVDEVVAVVQLARAQRIPIVRYGGGSGVCGGAVPLLGGITIDTKRMQQLRAVHTAELICDVEASQLSMKKPSGLLEREGSGCGATTTHERRRVHRWCCARDRTRPALARTALWWPSRRRIA